MALTLMYITNNPVTACIAQDAGVDRVWVDMEWIGKEERQKGMNTVKSQHTLEDVKNLRSVVTKAELLVRVNPLHKATKDYCDSEEEIDLTIKNGADVIMLPMFRTRADVEKFVEYVDGRAKVQLLLETAEAAQQLDDILLAKGVDEIHIGLNDLHLAYQKKFMFELLCDGTVEDLCAKMKQAGMKYGFGGIARVGHGTLPAEYIIAEHYRLGSTAAILSRGFCDANIINDPMEIKSIFLAGVKDIRLKEKEVAQFSEEEYQRNLQIIKTKVKEILAEK